jgi:hypothetical protein
MKLTFNKKCCIVKLPTMKPTKESQSSCLPHFEMVLRIQVLDNTKLFYITMDESKHIWSVVHAYNVMSYKMLLLHMASLYRVK